jgi:hypothetical protein
VCNRCGTGAIAWCTDPGRHAEDKPLHRANSLVIQPSAWGWSLYDTDRTGGELDALVSSAGELNNLVRYAVITLKSPVRVLPVPELFT